MEQALTPKRQFRHCGPRRAYITVTMHPDLRDTLKEAASSQKLPFSHYVEDLLRAAVDSGLTGTT